MNEFIKWIAQNLGVKYPIISTVVVMILAAIGWRSFVHYVSRDSHPTAGSIVQESGSSVGCSNIVASGSASVNCSASEGQKVDNKDQNHAKAPDKH